MRLMVKCKSFNKCNIVRSSQKSVRNRECTDLLRGSRLLLPRDYRRVSLKSPRPDERVRAIGKSARQQVPGKPGTTRGCIRVLFFLPCHVRPAREPRETEIWLPREFVPDRRIDSACWLRMGAKEANESSTSRRPHRMSSCACVALAPPLYEVIGNHRTHYRYHRSDITNNDY